MKKSFIFLLILATCFSFHPNISMAFDGENTISTNEKTDVVTEADLGGQGWLINEVNRQLSPKKVGTDLTFEDLTKITRIILPDKNLTGEVPPEIKNIVSLQDLLLYSNKLTGTIPAELGELKNLKTLRLDYNQLTGTVPEGLGNIDLVQLQLNKLVGQLPLSLYENRTGSNEVNVSGNQVTIDGTTNVPSVYSAYTFVYPYPYSEYSGKIKALHPYIYNLDNSMNFTPFLKGSATFIDLQAANMFDSALFAGHHVTITDEGNLKVLYDGELTEDVSIPLSGWNSDSHRLSVVLDKAFNNPQNKVVIFLNILAVQGEDVTVEYVNENGESIHVSQLISGDIGDEYDATMEEYKLAIDKYTLDESKLPANAVGTFSNEAKTVTYVYNKIDGAPITVKYLDENGTEIAEADTLTGKIDAPYETTPKEISGWVVDENKLPTNKTGNFTAEGQTVTYTYKTNQTKISAHDSTIYVDDAWNAKDNFDTAYDKYGIEVPFDKVSVEGAVNTSKPGVYSVKYIYDGAETVIKVTVKAKDVPVDPTNPIDPALSPSVTPNQSSNSAVKVISVPSEQGEWKLPTTGDDRFDSILYIGAGIAVIFAAISLLRKRKIHL
ncbi:LPXTG cell wall anchor domain-containing protein [Listeria seeligeri]|uniref:LPXTG cell wall anchor domain-containing protein n=1 Tax=Listeria seeligeri TaxID=1640 RepID=A0A7X0X3M7_LISSE|nr:MucBP domain-containing protein [Listeria seeligeri]MBC1487041.1 LPXTG cell wall anchor domain-containing protein [Listeria seeligeri]